MSLLDDLPGKEPIAGGSYPDVDQPSCQLLGPTALIVQGLLGVFVILSLVLKRHRESPKRPWRIWLFDVSKQVVGQMFVHVANLLLSGFFSQHDSGNACVSYFLHILIDTTFGVAFIYVTLHALTRLFTEKFHLQGFEMGVYGNPPAVKYWARQATLYVSSLLTMKILVITFLYLFPGMYVAGKWLLSWTWTGEGDDLQVIFTMGIFPIIMNVLQFWLIDSIVKASVAAGVVLDVESTYHDREPLFRATADEDGDDGPSGPNIDYRNSPRTSVSSVGSKDMESHEAKPYLTGTSTPNEHKSSASSSRRVADGHAYPPSLSSSISSDAPLNPDVKVPRSANNLMKKAKRRDPPTPLNIRSPRAQASTSAKLTASRTGIPRTPSPQFVPVAVVDDTNAAWGDSWDHTNDWAKDNEQDGTILKQHSLATNSAWNSTHPAVHVDS
ncbi:vacuolar membrane protein-domain-containing protein [Crassisporium funariophilum]|nr:vacuolar membrane protein-domain-containing protein [Crassisporium funariophilum]